MCLEVSTIRVRTSVNLGQAGFNMITVKSWKIIFPSGIVVRLFAVIISVQVEIIISRCEDDSNCYILKILL